jgi:putative tryptophan/tyrosine transport system substrate-binding protein
MQRREFITLLGGATAWPLAARAQQGGKLPTIGFLSGQSALPFGPLTAAFLEGLKETGFVEGQNVEIVYRWAEGQFDRLPSLAADLVARQVTIIVATGGEPSVFAAKAATTTIPIVFTAGGDPVKQGLVTTLNRPGGNLTGMFFLAASVESKRLGLLRELVPNAATFAVLWNPNAPGGAPQLNDIERSAAEIGQQLLILKANRDPDIDACFDMIVQQRIGALLIAADPFFSSRLGHIVMLTQRYAVPAMYALREFAALGGLVSYGASLSAAFRQVGVYAGKVLRGEKPGNLPIMQPTKFDLIINLPTAKALGLAVPEKLIALADEVIE